MNPIAYLKKNGIRHAFEVLYKFKMQVIIENVVLLCNKKKPLKDIIIIESHNDFDCNGGAFYQYLLKNGYNRRYKIVWLLKHKAPDCLPDNVVTLPIYGPSFKKAYYRSVAKIMTADCYITPKLRREQKSFYFTHGPIGLKNCKGKLPFPDTVDYCLAPSEEYAPIMADQFTLPYPNEKFVYLGYPMHDVLYEPPTGEMKKITNQCFHKTILWMPTFRKGGGFQRNDSTAEQPLGIPMIETEEQYERLNLDLAKLETLLIIKLHPMQDKDTIKITDRSHIKVLTGETVKALQVDNYRLMKETDALVSDYSSVAFDYLHLDRPIGYMLADEKEYKLGFVVEDPRTMMAGDEINTYEEFVQFFSDIAEGKDRFAERRHDLVNRLYKYHDGDSCKRIAEFMQL